MDNKKEDRKNETYEKEVDKCLDITLKDILERRLYKQRQRIRRNQNKRSTMRG